jgi:hypothetical protein
MRWELILVSANATMRLLSRLQSGRAMRRIGTTFEQTRELYERARMVFSSRRSEADFQAWRDQQAWTAEKYRRLDRGGRMPPDWRVGELQPPQG